MESADDCETADESFEVQGDAVNSNVINSPAAVQEQLEDNIDETRMPSLDLSNIEDLSRKFLNQFEPDLTSTESKLWDVAQNQTVLIETLQRENQRLNSQAAVNEIESAMALVHHYHMKLLKIRKEMSSLSDVSQRLKRDALRLQQQKEKDLLKKEEQKSRVLAEERKLVAQFAPNSEPAEMLQQIVIFFYLDLCGNCKDCAPIVCWTSTFCWYTYILFAYWSNIYVPGMSV